MRLHHIGIATEDINATIEYIKNFVVIESVSATVYDSKQDANLCMLSVKDGSNIELIQGEVISKIIKKGQYIYHLCWETEDIEKQIQMLIDKNGLVISPLKEAVLFDNRRVAFIMTDIGLVELLEK